MGIIIFHFLLPKMSIMRKNGNDGRDNVAQWLEETVRRQ